MCNHAVKKLPFVIRHVPNQYKTQKMCDKAILQNGGTLRSVLDSYKNQQMCDKSVDSYPHALEFVPECYKNKKRVIKLLMLTLLQLNISLIDLRLNKYMIKPLINVLLHLILFSINK